MLEMPVVIAKCLLAEGSIDPKERTPKIKGEGVPRGDACFKTMVRKV